MLPRFEQREDRREFFRAAARYGLLAVVSSIAALAGRSRRTERQRCWNSGICRGCSHFTACGLPAALSAKRAQSRG